MSDGRFNVRNDGSVISRLLIDLIGVLGGPLSIQGVDADDAPVTVNPIVVGGVHYADPSANPIDDGDAGYLLLTDERRAAIENRVYDAPTDADRNVPVWSPPDLFQPEGITGSASGNGTTSYYVSMGPFSRWSLQFIPAIAGGETITMRVFQSDHDVDDPTLATYQDVTNEFFGVPGFTTARWVEPSNATRTKFLRIDVIITGYTAGSPAWTIHAAKGGNS